MDLYDDTSIENSKKIDFIKEAEEDAFKKKEIGKLNFGKLKSRRKVK